MLEWLKTFIRLFPPVYSRYAININFPNCTAVFLIHCDKEP